MVELNDIYSARLLELAADIPLSEMLTDPDAMATAHSKLCGSTVHVSLNAKDGVITDFGQTVKACLLGQAAASIVGSHIIGTTFEEFHAVAGAMRKMLKADGPQPDGRWCDLGLLEPVRPYKSRHASTLLIFDAVERAIAGIEAGVQPDDLRPAKGSSERAAPSAARAH
ncbi:MAG TPA: iron-sulfur cluster assembly scaffold protein [Hyphomicrobiaceae bacterium]|nr:iron-sulfur cluster assembly scaffold protein [Hyphomicrobiaceae bacterium]